MSIELLFFSADWCDPCKWADPIVREAIDKSPGKISLRKIDIDEEKLLAHENHVLSVPTLVLFKDGNEVWRMKGFDTVQNLQRIFSAHL